MKVGAIIQARTGSTRLPGKVLKELPYGSGITVLQQVIRRLKRAQTLDEIIVATTTKAEDLPIVEIAELENVSFCRGPEKDVLTRYYNCAKEHKLDIIVRITSDCPCIDPQVVDFIVKKHIEENADYTSNTLGGRTYPHGLDTEVISFKALEIAFKEADRPDEREHVCPYIYGRGKDKFKVVPVKAPPELHAPDIRITLDTEEDYALLCCVFDNLYPQNPQFGAEEIIKLFREKPWLKIINKKVVQKKPFHRLEDELKEAIKVLELQELNRAKEILEETLRDILNRENL
jgi:spore coat polysaccharide biosynthesis protein SpsF